MDVGEKELKEILREQREEYQRYLGVATDSFESQTKLIAESVSGVQEQLVAIRDLVVKNTQDIETIRNMVARNTEDIAIMKADLHIIKDDLKEKIGREEFKVLERRVELLEKKPQRA